MGIALYHEVKPSRSGKALPAEARSAKAGPRKPSLDEMGPGVESVPARDDDRLPRRSPQGEGGRSKLGRPGQHGGFKSNKRR